MKIKRLSLLALVLCMSALFLPVTAYAATDTTPPSINAWVEGDTLHAETSDRGTGVEAVYIDGHRIGYLVDGAVEVGLSGYSGDGEYITVYAVDFAGNKSSEVKLNNPSYTAPAASSTPSGTTPAPTPTQNSTSSSSSTSQPSQSSSTSQPASSSASAASDTTADADGDSSESAIPDESGTNAFTPDGTGSVQDNATEEDGKEFFTITTEAGNVFYLIIDRQKDENGVYLLNTVTEADLMALAESSGGSSSGESVIPDTTPEPTPTPEPEPTPDPEPVEEPAAENNTGTMIFIIIAALAAGGAGYYFKILKPKQQAAFDGEDEDDPDEYDDYSDDEDEYDFSDDAEFLDDDLEPEQEADSQ